MKRPRRPAEGARGPAAPAAPSRTRAAPPGAWLDRACRFAPFAALAVLAWSLRGAPLGAPVADDFEFLARTTLHPAPDFLDTMGASYYWRPLSRQVWFPLVTPLLLAAPGAVAAIHVALVAATAFVLARVARRVVPAAAAALVGAAVIASEPARVLVTWPSGSQHLLAALGLALAAHESLAGRRWTAAVAAVAAALSHELGAFAFAFVALGGVARRAGRAAWLDAALAAALAAAYAAGYRAALAHGVTLPARGELPAAAAWLETLRLLLAAGFNAETLGAGVAGPLVVTTELLFGAALLVLLRPSRRAEIPALVPFVAAPLLAAWLGAVPLASLLPDWNAWRAWVPVVGLVFAVAIAAARAHPALGLAFVALRLAALAGAAPAAPVTGLAPPAVSDLSFARLTRIQHVVSASGAIVRATTLPPGGRVVFIGLPQMTSNGFRGDRAAQVWTRDTSVRFVSADDRGLATDTTALVLSFDVRTGRAPALALTVEARRWWRLAHAAMDQRRSDEAWEFFRRAIAAQAPESPSLSANALQNMSLLAVERGRLGTADSLNREAYRVRGPTADGFALDALVALRGGDLPRARRALDACLKLDARNPVAQAVLAEYQAAAAAQGPVGSPGH